MATKIPTGSFYAVRKGKGNLEKCIFMHYKDAQPFIEGEEDDDDESVEYHVFDALEDAAAYLQTTTEPLDAKMLASIATVVNVPPSKKRRTSYESTDGGQHRRPTKKWEECFALLKESKLPGGGFKDQDMDKMTKWMKDQRYNYKLYQQGKPSSMTSDKIRRLRDVGFTLPQIECTAPLVKAETPSKEKRGIYKKWYDNRDYLKAYMDAHEGSWDISKDDKENAKLKSWLDNQQTEYKKFMNGQESSMTQEKLQLLKDIGFEFTYIPFDERFEQLRAFKQEHGHVDVPATHAELGKWMQSIRRQCKSFADTAESTRDIDAKRFAQLTAIGVDPNRKLVKNEEEEAQKWDEMFAKLEEFKRDHGDLNVKRDPETRDLYNWVVLQRNEYKKLQHDKPSKLTAPRLIKFNQIGFEFGKRGTYKNWEQRVEQLKEYKEKNGHVNIPVTDPELGEFVSRQRVNYNKLRYVLCWRALLHVIVVLWIFCIRHCSPLYNTRSLALYLPPAMAKRRP